MNILIIDGQGGGIGAGLVRAVKEKRPEAFVTAAGTNALAAAAMKKAGADAAAAGENAVVVGCRSADVIICPIACVIADALFGEITPDMARAVGQSGAKRILLPFNRCGNVVVGVRELSPAALIALAVEAI
ncbi:MAG TPA: hypothetical protein DD735_02555 [Clostridiales bacterium]|nr:hypothetical protein [Clostridiales bacterium]